MTDVKTVKIVHNDGYTTINAGDYNDKIHQLYIEPEVTEEQESEKEDVKEEKPKAPKKKKGK